MARTCNLPQLSPSATDERPTPIPWNVPGFRADLGLIYAIQLDENSVILVPEKLLDNIDDPLDDSWRDEHGAGRCWKTTVIYEQISETHPHLVP
jgi:hypothetical protein